MMMMMIMVLLLAGRDDDVDDDAKVWRPENEPAVVVHPSLPCYT